jgi:maltooligosyltrehalose trehalohydrolase
VAHFSHTEHAIAEGQRYAYRLSGSLERLDLALRWQPYSVHHASAVLRPETCAWSDHTWRGTPWEDLVFYELHVGTFAPEGTFEALFRGSRLHVSWA